MALKWFTKLEVAQKRYPIVCQGHPSNFKVTQHDVQFSCAITQPLLAHHWSVHQCLLTSRFIAPSIPWGVSAPGGKMRKQLLKDHNFLNYSPIFVIESSTSNIFAFQKHCIQYISSWKMVLDLVKGTWHHNLMAGCGSLLWANTCSLWSGIKSWPRAGCLQLLVRCRCQQPTMSLPNMHYRHHDDRKSPIFTQIEHFWTVTPVWIHQWNWNDAQSII